MLGVASVAEDGDILLTAKETADRLRMSVKTIHKWHGDGTLPGVRLGKRSVRFRVADVLALIKAGWRNGNGAQP